MARWSRICSPERARRDRLAPATSPRVDGQRQLRNDGSRSRGEDGPRKSGFGPRSFPNSLAPPSRAPQGMTDVTSILEAIGQGDPAAAERLLPLVYDELRRLAARQLGREA